MGQTLTTPLSLTLTHFPDVRARAHHLSVEVCKGQWKTLCSSEWPTLHGEWPRDRTFNLSIILQVKAKVMDPGPLGHPDQVAYIITWEDLVRSPPSWVKPFLHSPSPSQSTLLALEVPKNRNPDPHKPVLPDEPQRDLLLLDPLPPPPQDPLLRPPPYASPLPPVLSPALSSFPTLSPTSPSAPPSTPSPSPAPPKLTPRTPPPTPPRLHLRRTEDPDGPSTWQSSLFPLHTVNRTVQYWPFSASDLYNWKTHNPSFSQDPQALTSLIESILLTHQPTWDDCQQLLQVLLTTEERQRVLLEARKNVPGPGGLPTQLPNEIDEGFPLTRPDWDYETAPGRESLRIYRQALLAGLKGAGKCPTNLAKVRTITQERDESPAAFMERLLEGFRMYTPFDPEALEHKATVAMAFIDQAALDIKGKLQRLDGIQTYGLQELVREAEKVYNKRETPEEREARLAKEQMEREDRRDRVRDKHLTKILAAVVREKGPGREGEKRRRPKVEKDQCAYCKERGHWIKDCPKRPKDQKKPAAVLTLGEDSE
uniref:CCHC-type domain-containing protein n=1 Tax=Macaca fascicularis TaxID=9541 RepID=A0A7N9CEZ5_MACFA